MTLRTLLPSTVAILASCSDMGALDPYVPDVSFDRMEHTAVTWEQIDTDFVFVVDNPNPIEIKLARFDYALAFEQIEWLNGDDPDGLVLKADDGSEVALPVSIGFEELFDVIEATRGADTIGFGLDGSFGFNTPVGIVDLPYDEDGAFPALRTPTFEYETLRVADMTFETATVELDFAVDNAHESDLPFTNFDYDLRMEGEHVASGLVEDLGVVNGAKTGTLTVPIEIDLAESGTAIYEALTGNRVQMGIEATTDVGTPWGIVPLSIDESGDVRVE